MSDKTVKAVKEYLYGQTRPRPHQLNDMHQMELAYGRRNKRAIDAHRTNQDYYRMKVVQTPLLDHYENVDWYERDSSMDLVPYM